MRVALVSDVHLGGTSDPNQARFLEFMRKLEVDRLCVLGDLFQHWWHFGEEPFSEYLPVIHELERFPLSFVPGNHDWKAGEWLQKHLGAEVGPALSYQWDGLRVYLSHGDEADNSAGYRSLSWLLRSGGFGALVDAMGPARAWRFLGKIAGKPHPSRSPDPRLLARQEAVARSALQHADLVVLGHTHQPCKKQLGEGWYVNLGEFVFRSDWLLLDSGIIQPQTTF